MSRLDPSVLLLYPPNQSWPGAMCKPNGSLAYPSLGGALLDAGIQVSVYDACVGDEADDLDAVFHRASPLPSGLLRTGVPDERIVAAAAGRDVVGITSIFTDQETMVLATARLLRAHRPDLLLVAGGVNARFRLRRFFDAGFDLVCLGEAERTICDIVGAWRAGGRDFSAIAGVAWCQDGEVRCNPAGADLRLDLDTLPMPAWHLLPNERYWAVGRPHGGRFEPGARLRYASIVTSLGCPFRCAFCHIASEREGSPSGAIGRYRVKSDERVVAELDVLRGLGVRQVFIEDDSLLGYKRRSLRLLRRIVDAGFEIIDVNGVNVVHLLKGGRPDVEVIEVLAAAGFTEISLPFESASPRIIREYASSKWDVEGSDADGLIDACVRHGIRVSGNYMLGYPDETLAEATATIAMARRHMALGMDSAGFYLVMPLPGTPLFERALREGYLAPDYDPDRMYWTKTTMRNTVIPADQLAALRDAAWDEVNGPAFRDYKRSQVVGQPEG